MAKLRKFSAYCRLERPYTRKSKFRKKSFVRAAPVSRVIRYDMGNAQKKFEYTLNLVSTTGLQIRHNAIEAARQTSNRLLEKVCGKNAYNMRIRIYPHHVLRENPLAAGAGADRMSTGMQKSFGKCIGLAARVKRGKEIVTVEVDKQHLKTAKLALQRAAYKVPCSCKIEVTKNI